MSYLGSWKIDDALTFVVNTHDPTDGSASDADGVPTYRVYEDETTSPILTGSMALLDSTNTVGFYSEAITLSAANGLEKGKCYSIYITATTNSVETTMHHTFQMEAEVDANTISASTSTAGDIADAVWDEARSAHTTAGSYGEVFAQIQSGTVDDTAVSPTPTSLESDDITEATADHYIGRAIYPTSGAMRYQFATITGYSFNSPRGVFTFSAGFPSGETIANDVTFIIV